MRSAETPYSSASSCSRDSALLATGEGHVSELSSGTSSSSMRSSASSMGRSSWTWTNETPPALVGIYHDEAEMGNFRRLPIEFD